MRQAAFVLAALASVVSATLASADQGRQRNQAPAKAEAPPPERFVYLPASDRNIRVTVNNVVLRGDPDYIPRANNWLQINLTIANVSRRTLTVGSVQGRLASGTLFGSAREYNNILREPTVSQIMTSGVAEGAGTAAAGLFLFPMAGLIAGAGSMVADIFTARRREQRYQRYQESVLTLGPIAPGTNLSGNVYLPALRGQDGIFVFYVLGGSDESLEIRRSPVR